MHKLPQRMLDQLLKPQAQHSTVAGAAALQRSGLPALLRDALQAAFNKSQVRPCSRLNPAVSGLLRARGTCRQSIGVTAQVAAIAESVVGREPFALVQVRPGPVPCIVPCSAKPVLLLIAPLQLRWQRNRVVCMHLQGPPGTGKTSSTIGIISALVARAAPSDLSGDLAPSLDADMPAVQVLDWHRCSM